MKGTTMALSQEHQAAAAHFGIDLSKIDWTKVLQVVQFLINLFAQQPHTKTLKDAGCPDDDNACGCHCLEAAVKALEAARLSLTCCQDCCKTQP